jgi:hypothetical protein
VWYPPQKPEISFAMPGHVKTIKSGAIYNAHLLHLTSGTNLKLLEPDFCSRSMKAYHIQSMSFVSVDGLVYGQSMSAIFACLKNVL